MVFGKLSYGDYWGQYIMTFCNPMVVIRAGATIGKPTPNDIKCYEYAHNESEYTHRPEIKPLPAPLKIDPIKCVLPPE